MSGQQVTASGPLNATERARAYLDALKLKPEQASEQASELLTLPAERLTAALSARDPILPYGSIYFGPVLDDRSLTRHPFYPDAPAQSAKVPMIIGNTHDETRAFLGSDEANFTVGWDALAARLAPNLRVDIDPEMVIAEYRRLYPAYSPSEVLFAASTASRSWRAAVIEAELRAKQGSPAWVYQLDFPSPDARLRAMHTLDIPLVFDNTAAKGSKTGDGPEARRLAEQMSRAFIAFAHTGDPNHAGLPRWERYELPRRQTMIFDATSRMADDPRGAERELFARVPFIQSGT
jgi:para-nitrobenzyl esterase